MTRLTGWFGGSAAEAERLPVRTAGLGRGKVRSPSPVRLMGFDQALVWVVAALALFGLVMVYSASIAMPDNPKFARYEHTHFLMRHVLSLASGIL